MLYSDDTLFEATHGPLLRKKDGVTSALSNGGMSLHSKEGIKGYRDDLLWFRAAYNLHQGRGDHSHVTFLCYSNTIGA
jgi:hypothetical protein